MFIKLTKQLHIERKMPQQQLTATMLDIVIFLKIFLMPITQLPILFQDILFHQYTLLTGLLIIFLEHKNQIHELTS
jgi:hypothetical protein